MPRRQQPACRSGAPKARCDCHASWYRSRVVHEVVPGIKRCAGALHGAELRPRTNLSPGWKRRHAKRRSGRGGRIAFRRRGGTRGSDGGRSSGWRYGMSRRHRVRKLFELGLRVGGGGQPVVARACSERRWTGSERRQQRATHPFSISESKHVPRRAGADRPGDHGRPRDLSILRRRPATLRPQRNIAAKPRDTLPPDWP